MFLALDGGATLNAALYPSKACSVPNQMEGSTESICSIPISFRIKRDHGAKASQSALRDMMGGV